MLNVLTKVLDIKIDMTEIGKKAKETEEQMGQMTKAIASYRKAVEKQQEMINESPSYIR